MYETDLDDFHHPEDAQERTLVLNASYEPMMVVNWRRAIALIWLEKVETLAHYDRQIVSVSARVPMPAVVRLHRQVPRRKLSVRFSRSNVYARDRSTCQYCGVRFSPADLTYDHVIPRSRGGKTSWTNIVTCCVGCNRIKGNRTPDQAGMRLLRPPAVPDWLPVVGRSLATREPPEAWKPFLWNTA